jgi:hypothetical protein
MGGTESLITSGGCANLAAVTTCTDTGLGNGDNVHYQVIAVNSQGDSGRSPTATATTFALPTVTRNLHASPGLGQVTLSWFGPDNYGGTPLTGYRVYRTLNGGSEALLTSGGCFSPGSGSAMACTDTGLPAGATLHYRISATNLVGEGPLGTGLDATTFAAPASPSSLIVSAGPGAGNLMLAWNAPGSNGGTPITAYKVYRNNGGGEALVSVGGCSSLGAVLSCTDSGLGNGATVSYRVSAVNLVDEGAKSATASGTTFSPPGPPQNLSASAGIGIRLDWQAPASNGGAAVTGYQVYRAVGNGTLQFVASGGCSGLGDVRTCTDMDCPLLSVCTYEVRAVNLVGAGPGSNHASAWSPLVPNPLVGVLPECLDGSDNDGDGGVDYRPLGGDADCSSLLDGLEAA